MQVETSRLRVVSPETPEPRPPEPAEASTPLQPPSPGPYIREQRQRLGMSVEQLAAATKIPRTSLVLLEEGRYCELPGPVFVKGFLRCAARALELDPDAVMDLLHAREREALHDKRSQRPTESESSGKRDARRSGVVPRADEALSRIVALMTTRMPSLTLALWIALIVFVGMVLLAALNLMGTSLSPQI